MDTSLLSGLIFFLAFASMIILHELGHYFAARYLGIEVDEFGFGIPPRMLTVWRMKGHFITKSGKRIEIPREFGLPFSWSEILKRPLTISVDDQDGALVLRSITLVEEVSQQKQADQDKIRVDAHGKILPTQAESAPEMKTLQIGKRRGAHELTETITEAHAGTEFTLNWLPIGGFVRPKGENDPTIAGGLAAATPWRRLGVLIAGPAMNLITALFFFIFLVRMDGYHDFSTVQLAAIAPNSPAEQAGMLAGDVLVSIDGQAITSSDSVLQVIDKNLGQPIEFVLLRDGAAVSVTAAPREHPPEGQGAVGIAMGHLIVPVNSWGESLQYGARSVLNSSREILLFPARMIQGTLAPGEGRFIGLKGISDVFNITVSSDVESRAPTTTSGDEAPTFATLYLIATLTISIGLFNLFPFPALDGGRIIFVIPEILFRRRVPQQFENAVHAAGMMLLLLLMLYVNIMDFVNPIQLLP